MKQALSFCKSQHLSSPPPPPKVLKKVTCDFFGRQNLSNRFFSFLVFKIFNQNDKKTGFFAHSIQKRYFYRRWSCLLSGVLCCLFLSNTACTSLGWKTPKKQTKLEQKTSSEKASPTSTQKNQRTTAGMSTAARAILNKIGEIARKRADDMFESIDENRNFQYRDYPNMFKKYPHYSTHIHSIDGAGDINFHPFILTENRRIPFYNNLDFYNNLGFNFKGSNFQEIKFRLLSIETGNDELISYLEKYLGYLKHGGDYKKDLYGFARSNLTDANMRQTVADFMSFEEALMIGTKMEEGRFAWSLFREADLTGAVANRAILYGTDWTDAIMPGAKFNEAILIGAQFRGGNLDLRWTEFMGADLRGYHHHVRGETKASLSTSFESVDLETMKTINFQGAIYNEYTRFPAGFDPKKAGMIEKPIRKFNLIEIVDIPTTSYDRSSNGGPIMFDRLIPENVFSLTPRW